MNLDEFSQVRQQMVNEQLAQRGIRDVRILAVMNAVPRHLFVHPDELAWAYSDGPLPIGHMQTISQPYIVALMTETLQVEAIDRILEVGTGSGYQAAVLGMLAREIHTVELIPELADTAATTLAGLKYDNIHVHFGDGSLGWPEAAPYDGILVAAAAPMTPQPLLDQLADGGKLVIPVGASGYQQLEVWERRGKELIHQTSIGVSFVPLRGEYGWKK